MTLSELARWTGLVATGWTILFQLALAAGAPLGALAWGGADAGRLPARKRAASLAAALVLMLPAGAFGQRAGLWSLWSDTASLVILWGTALLFSLSFVGNLASQSPAERAHGAPLAAVLAVSAAIVALS